MIDICFLGGLYPHEIEKELYANSKWGICYAANNHQWRLIEGFEQNRAHLTVITAPFLSTFLRGYKKLNVPECTFGNKGNYISVGYRNIFLLGNAESKIFNELERWYSNTTGTSKCVLIYCLEGSIIKAALKLRNRHKDVKLCQMIPDLPEDMAANWLYKALGFKKRSLEFIYSSMPKMDMFIYLSKYMNDAIGNITRPYIVSEGVYKDTGVYNIEDKLENTILYTGNLNRKYGIEHLVESFKLLGKDYKLYVRGDGDMVEYVKQQSVLNPEIVYLPRMDYEELKRLQRQVSVLVNPVLPTEKFTYNFFPSKTMEYLASGTPVVMYRLGGVPEEYYDYIHTPDDLSLEALSRKLREICNLTIEESRQMGTKSREFILSNKSAKVMTQRILDFIDLHT